MLKMKVATTALTTFLSALFTGLEFASVGCYAYITSSRSTRALKRKHCESNLYQQQFFQSPSTQLWSMLERVDIDVKIETAKPQMQQEHFNEIILTPPNLLDHTSILDTIIDSPNAEVDMPIVNWNTSISSDIETPSVFKILSYTVPAIGIWLCSPVLSMIDTAAVGLLSGTAQQAALNPAVSVTDYMGLVVAFMYTATTNLIAAAQQHDKTLTNADSNPRTPTTLVTGLKLAVLIGLAFGAIMSLSASSLIHILVGKGAIDSTVIAAALRYVRIRCLGMPAALMIGTAQSACLGMQDVRSPLYVLIAAALINFCGDLLLVGNSNPWLGGTAGAAWATVLSQYGALFMFWRWLTTKPEKKRDKNEINAKFFDGSFKKCEDTGYIVNITKAIIELTGSSEEGKPRRRQFLQSLSSSPSTALLPRVPSPKSPPKTRGFLADGKLELKNFMRISEFDIPTAKSFLPFVIPVTTTSIGRISGYIAMSHVASSTLGTFDLAAHQIILSIFCCLTPLVDALSQVAQSLVPGIFERKEKTVRRAIALSNTVMNFRKCGAVFGAVLVSLAACIPMISQYFTTDAMVINKVNGAIPGVGLFLFVNGLMNAGEGSLLGQKDLRFLRNMYILFFFTVPAYMLRLKHRSLSGIQDVGLGTMWAAFSIYNVIRTSIIHIRLSQLQRRTNRSVVQSDS